MVKEITKRINKKLSKEGVAGGIVVGFFILLVGTSGMHWMIRDAVSAYESKSWPKVRGVIIESNIDRDRSGRYYVKGKKPRIVYQYAIGNMGFYGRLIGFPSRYAEKKLSRDQLASFRNKAIVSVYYNPYKYQEACLMPGQIPQSFMVSIIAISFIFICCGVLMIAYMFRYYCVNK